MKADTRLETHATLQMLRQEGFNHDLLDGVSERANRILKIIDDHNDSAKAIMSSPEFTEKGKQSQIAQLNRRTRDLLEAEKFKGKCYGDQIASLERIVRSKQLPASDPVLAYLREREIRDRLQGKTGLELQLIYEEAGAKGNDIVQTAIENDLFTSLPAEILAAGKQARAMRLDPETAAKVRDLQTVNKVFEDTIQLAQAELGISDDVTAAVASGTTV